MDQFVQALWMVAAATITALAGIALPLVRAYTLNLMQQRLGDGAARAAGDIAAQVAGSPNVEVATTAMIDAGVAALRARYPNTAGKLPLSTLAGMIRGELGRLGQGVAVAK